MAYPFLPSIELASYTTSPRGLDPKALSYIGSAFTTITPDTIDDAFAHLQQTVGTLATHFDVSALPSLDDIVALLDAGAAKVFVGAEQLAQLQTHKSLDSSRVVLKVDASASALDASPSVALYLQQVRDAAVVETLVRDGRAVYVSLAEPSAESVLRVARLAAVPVVPATALAADARGDPQLISAATLLLANATSDRPDGLFTTLVTDERGVALGLVYSSEESVAESLRTGRGVYQSRKRGLWYKGESSGDVQELVGITSDCDHDCLRFVVRQKGRGGYRHASLSAVELTRARLLPSGNRNLLWRVPWPVSSATDAPEP